MIAEEIAGGRRYRCNDFDFDDDFDDLIFTVKKKEPIQCITAQGASRVAD